MKRLLRFLQSEDGGLSLRLGVFLGRGGGTGGSGGTPYTGNLELEGDGSGNLELEGDGSGNLELEGNS